MQILGKNANSENVKKILETNIIIMRKSELPKLNKCWSSALAWPQLRIKSCLLGSRQEELIYNELKPKLTT
jgi:hypothetical protein